jgi:BMFP domain-containing protein YqiC
MEAIEKLKLQIGRLLQKLELLKEENSDLRAKAIKTESENRAKDEYIKALEHKIASIENSEIKSLDAKG